MLVIAHRGSSQQAPENTLPAIQKAIQDQADAVEIDVQLTKDQEIVVIHDEWLNRTTNGSGLVSSHTFSRIRELDAGSWFSPNFSGVRIPHLEEVLLLLKPLSIELNIELKNGIIPYPGLEEKVIRLIQNYQMEKQVILSSFRQDSLARCFQIAPSIRRGLLCLTVTESLYQTERWDRLQLYSIHPHVAFLHAQMKNFQQKGYRIFPYVVERKKELALCQKYQVDGFFTNSPRMAKKILTPS